MKKIILTLFAMACALGASAAGDWKETLGKVKDLSGDTGIAGFARKEAPAYITGNFAEADRAPVPDMTKPRVGANVGANRNGYWMWADSS